MVLCCCCCCRRLPVSGALCVQALPASPCWRPVWQGACPLSRSAAPACCCCCRPPAAGNAARREAGLRLEKMRQAEIKRRRQEQRGEKKANSKAVRMPGKDAASFDV